MSSWRVQGQNGRWAAVDNKGTFSADAETEVDVLGFAGRAVPITPTGPGYAATDDDDPVWWYLMALHLIPGPFTITGTPPPVPAPPPADAESNATF